MPCKKLLLIGFCCVSLLAFGQKKSYHKAFFADGTLKEEGWIKNDQKNGYCLIYDMEKLVKASKYKEGKKIKEWTDFKSFKKENKLSDLRS